MRRNRLLPLAGALGAALLMCSGYVVSMVARSAWKARFPELVEKWPNGGRHTLLGMFGTEVQMEELAYAARAREAAEHFLAYDAFVAENKSVRLMVGEFVIYKLLGGFFLLTGDMSNAWLLIRFTCCFVWFLAVYRFVGSIADDPAIAFFSATFLTGFSYLTTGLFLQALHWYPTAWEDVLKNGWAVLSYGRTESVLRIPNPGFNYALWFLSSLLLVEVAARRRLSLAVLSGFVGGAMMYSRMDTGIAYMAAGWVFAFFLFLKGLDCWNVVASMSIATSLSVFWVLVNPMDIDLAGRTAILFGRELDVASLAYAALAVVFFRRQKAAAKQQHVLFIAAVLLAGFCIINLRLVTGYSIPPGYWRRLTNVGLVMGLTAFIPARWRRKEVWYGLSLAGMLIVFLQSTMYAAIRYPFQGLPLHLTGVLGWLDKNGIPDSTVLALNPEFNLLVPVFTKNKVILGNAGPNWSDLPTGEIAGRLNAAIDFYHMDRKRFLDECLPVGRMGGINRDDYERGRVECPVVHSAYFCIQSPAVSRDYIARTKPVALNVEYVWVGDFEAKYSLRPFKDRSFEKVYADRGGVLYQRRRDARPGG